MNHEKVLVIDFGGQYNQLIARRVRELNVYCIVKPYTISVVEIKQINPKGIIFTGGPNSVTDEGAPKCDPEVFNLNIPVLGICYGAQLMSYMLGGQVEMAESREYGKTEIEKDDVSVLLKNVSKTTTVWMSHTYYIKEVPQGFKVTSKSDNCSCGSMENTDKNLYAVQFHPEVNHTTEGSKILKSFLYDICKLKGDWLMADYAIEQVEILKEKIGDKKVLLALSGGVDSSVCAVLIHKAVGKNLTCIFVDHGLLRKDEGDQVEEIFTKQFDINLIRVNAQDRFLDKLAGVADPETKRKIIGEEFIRVFEDEAKKIGVVDYFAQGTIYPDIIESGVGDAAVIKSHHNVGGLPDHVDFKEIIEPLRELFKDEVRQIGLELSIPAPLVFRQPFPGPGLAVRIIGDITRDKILTLQGADAIFREEIAIAGLDKDINQYFAVLTNMRSVGVMGDERTYDYTLALRAVTTSDFMTADWAKIPYDVLEKASSRIVNEVKNINRICYDITTKPPSTIEWE